MKLRVPIIALTMLLFVGFAFAQDNRLVGVWELTEIHFPVPEGMTAPNAMDVWHPQPSITIFTQNYYSHTVMMGNEPRIPLPKDPTKEQLIESLRSYSSATGTYVFEDPILTIKMDASSIPNYTGKKTKFEISFEGDNSMTMRNYSANPEMIPMTFNYIRLE